MIRYIHGYADHSRKASRYLNFDPSNRKTIGFVKPIASMGIAKWMFKDDTMKKRINRYIYRERLRVPESRLDVAIWRATFAKNRYESANLVKTKQVSVNNKLITSPNFRLKSGDLVALSTKTLPLSITVSSSNYDLNTVSILPLTPISHATPVDPIPLHLEVDLSTSTFVYLRTPSLLPQHTITSTII